MKILFVSAYFDGHGGGIEKVVKVLSHSLVAQDGTDISWAAMGDVSQEAACEEIEKIFLSGTNICEARFGFPYPVVFLSAIKKLYRAVKKADLVHLHDYIYMSNLIAWMFAKILKKPIFVTQHIGVVNYKNPLLRNLHHFMNVSLGVFILRRVEKVIFISNAVEAYFRGLGGEGGENHWSYLPNGVDTTVFHPGNDLSAASRQGVLFVGRFVEKKGLNFLRKVAQLTPHVSYTFIGDGPLNPICWGLSNVKVVGYVADERKLAEYYRNARLLVLPSHGEGFPLVVQEALACGIKIIISEDVRSGCDGLIDDIVSIDIWQECAPKKWADRIVNELNSALTLDEQVMRFAHINAFINEEWSWKHVMKKHHEAYLTHLKWRV